MTDILRSARHHEVMAIIERKAMARRKLVPIEKPRLKFIGLSYDQKANMWRFFCTCGYDFIPQTTRLAKQNFFCDHCLSEWYVNYNTEEIKKVEAR